MQKPPESLNSTLTNYDLWSQDYDQFQNPMIAMVEWALSQKPLQVQNLNVLELGCGTGRNLPHLLKCEIKSYTGIDGSQGMLEKAQNQFRNSAARWILADLGSELPLPSDAFDFVLVTLVLEHLPSLDSIFSEAHRVLKPGGKFRILEIHSDLMKSGTQAHFWHDGKEHRFDSYPHDLLEYRQSLTTAGFQIEEIREWDPPAPLMQRMPKMKKHLGRPMIIDISGAIF